MCVCCVVGKNGSGKSNLLDAIQFVLSDRFSGRPEERSKLLYEGAGREIIAASVEVIFDNSDMRFPMEKETVSIRRSIGMKKDDYFLNSRHMTRQEISSLLESAGLSRSNPYYAVQQGRISQLIKMRDSERLELLKEIAGTRTYDERRRESARIMKETDSRRAAIADIIEYLERRLAELEEEKAELRQYQQLDVKRRMLEFTVYDKEQQHALQRLQELEEEKLSSQGQGEGQYDDYVKVRQRREEDEQKLQEMEARLKRVNADKKAAQQRRKDVLSLEKERELQVRDAEERVRQEEERRGDMSRTAERLRKEIEAKRAEMAAGQRDYEQKKAEEEAAKGEARRARQRLDDLNAKQGRSSQFTSKRERDAFLQTQKRELQRSVRDEEKRLEEVTDEVTQQEEKIAKLQTELGDRERERDSARGKVDSLKTAIEQRSSQRDELMNERKELQREEQSAEDGGAAMERKEKEYASLMDNETHRGISSIAAYVEQHPDIAPDFHGLVLDLFSCAPEFNRAVEASAGAALFHVVVATDAVASRLIAHLNAVRGGRVTFIPLNRVAAATAEPHAAPKTPDALPLLDKLRFDSRFRAVFVSIFGRVLLCRDLHVAAELSSAHDFTTLTLGGDKIDRKGVITGGWNEAKRSRIIVHSEWKAEKEASRQRRERRQRAKEELGKKEADVSRLLGEIHRQTEELRATRRRYETLQLETKHMQGTVQSMQETASRLRDAMRKLEESIAALSERLQAVDAELRSPFTSELSAEEQAELAQLVTTVKEQAAALAELTKQRTEMEIAQQRQQSHIGDNLERRLDEMVTALDSLSLEELKDGLARAREELKELVATRTEYDSAIKSSDDEIDSLLAAVKRAQAEIERLRAQEAKAKAAYNDSNLQLERLVAQRSKYQHKRDECARKIRELGSLQLAGQEAVRGRSVKQLLVLLEDINRQLLGFGHVNKKAMDQYVSLVEQREDLLSRKQELDDSRAAILQLIDHLDMKKDEAIERTFKQIAQHFSAVFAEMVPGGKGQLVIQTRQQDEETEEEMRDRRAREKDEAAIRRAREDRTAAAGSKKRRGRREQKEEEKEEQEEEERKQGPVAAQPPLTSLSYTGVGIKVSFASGSTAATHQLSGGQESVVALSLIFAIQRCDPSPFYLFDEIDSALDPVHRASVAAMIRKQKEDAQFICTTFSGELIEEADQCYGVVFQNKVSKVRLIDKDEAMQLVRISEHDQQRDDGQAGQDEEM